jgi:hypothetical protein
MEGKDAVASLVVIMGTILGCFQLLTNGDGTTITAMIGLYGTALGYAFGKATQK